MEVFEIDDDVGYLDFGVVDVVLCFDWVFEFVQVVNQNVVEDCIVQVFDVCSFVGIDVCVFDDDFGVFVFR